MMKQMVVVFLLESDATLGAECGFLGHLHSLRVVKGFQACSETLTMVI